MIVFPNAKINLGLNILFKREDGFHEIESIFLPVDLCDVLEFVENNNETSFQSTGIPIPGNPKDNLCVKAWGLLYKDFKIPSVKIHLHKHIPIGAGMGGGSADGAFMLSALSEYFKLGLPVERLKSYAGMLGSDCPFFIENKPTYVTGRGEKLEAIDLKLPECEIKIIYPDIHIGTKEAYANIKPSVPNQSLKEIIKRPCNEWQSTIKNDFEQSVFGNYKELQQVKNELIKNGAIYSSMTGSGSAIYGIFPELSNNIDSEIKKEYQLYSVKPIST